MFKKIALVAGALAVVGASASALAGGYPQEPMNHHQMTSSMYVGIGAGYGFADASSKNAFKLRHKGGFAGRVDAGYNFNQYLAVEGGYTYYSNTRRQFPDAQFKQKLSNYALDIMAKGTMHFQQFYAYVGAGAAYVHMNFHSVTDFASTSEGYVRPKLAVGVGYNFMPSLAVGVEYSRVFGQGHINEPKFMPNLNAALVTVDYAFAV